LSMMSPVWKRRFGNLPYQAGRFAAVACIAR